MSTSRRTPIVLSLLGASFVLALTAVPAEAQRRGPRGPAVRQVVVVGGGGPWAPRFWGYDPWLMGYGRFGPYGGFGPWGPWGPYGYPMGMRDNSAALRLDLEERDAEVFVDGYAAGIVDDFDGVFQRLRVAPGEHEIAVYRPGFRTVRQHLYLAPGSDQKLKFGLEALAAGEADEGRPVPIRREPAEAETSDRPEARPSETRGGPPARQLEVEPRRPSVGTLVVRLQPGDAEVFVDGERWAAPAGQERITIQLPEGRHKVEVRKAGFATYSEDILIRRSATLALNVSLLRG